MVQLIRINKNKYYNVELARSLEVDDLGSGRSRVYIRPTDGIDVTLYEGDSEKIYALLDAMHGRLGATVFDGPDIAYLNEQFQKLKDATS